MSKLVPLTQETASEKAQQTLERVQELFGEAPIPEPFGYYAHVPAFLQDFYMNFKKFCYSEGKLDERTKAAIALAISGYLGSEPWMEFWSARCRTLGWSDQALLDIAAVTASCSMYNTFFKFRDLSGSDLFGGMGVGLRAHTFAGTTLDDRLVELINVAVSDIAACKPCTEGHVAKARALGVSDEALLETIQCAATTYAGAQFLKSRGV